MLMVLLLTDPTVPVTEKFEVASKPNLCKSAKRGVEEVWRRQIYGWAND